MDNTEEFRGMIKMDMVTKYLQEYGCAYSESGDNINVPRGTIRSLLQKINQLKAENKKKNKALKICRENFGKISKQYKSGQHCICNDSAAVIDETLKANG